MRFTMSVEMDNAAFADDMHAEMARILDIVTTRVAEGYADGKCRDCNGNTVGTWAIEGE